MLTIFVLFNRYLVDLRKQRKWFSSEPITQAVLGPITQNPQSPAEDVRSRKRYCTHTHTQTAHDTPPHNPTSAPPHTPTQTHTHTHTHTHPPTHTHTHTHTHPQR